MVTEMERISAILDEGRRSGLSMEQILQIELGDWLHSKKREIMLQGEAYYLCRYKDTGLKNGVVRKLVKQKVDYLLSKQPSINADNSAYLEQVNNVLSDDFFKALKNAGTEAINKGIAWVQIYFEDNEMRFKVLPSEEVCPLWVDAEHEQLDGVIRAYDRIEYEGYSKVRVTHAEYWSKDGVKRYIYKAGALYPDVEMGDGAHFEINGKPYNWDKIPIIPFKYNNEEMPLLSAIKSLVDDSEAQKETISKLLTDIPNFIYVLKNYSGTDKEEFNEDVRKHRIILVDDDGGADKLSADINIAAYDTYQQQARKDIYEAARGVDTQAVDLGNASGQALKFRYADLDSDCNDLEAEFRWSFLQVIWFVNRYLEIMGKGNFDEENVEIVFNRDIIINELEAVQMCRDSQDVVSDETIVANHPFTKDVADEMQKLNRQREQAAKTQQEAFGMTPNSPPDTNNDEE